MKVEKRSPPPPEDEFVVTLTRSEAERLGTVLGVIGIGGGNEGSEKTYKEVVTALCAALRDSGADISSNGRKLRPMWLEVGL